MSLLMDALKKAEKAKQGTPVVAPQSASGTPSAVGSGPATDWPVLTIEMSPAEIESELGFDPARTKSAVAPAPPAEHKAGSAISLEPLSRNRAPIEAPPGIIAPPPPAIPPPAAVISPGSGDRASMAGTQAAERQAAKGVFSAKRPATAGESSRRPFFTIIGLLVLAGAGGAYYFWTQLQVPATPAFAPPSGAASGVINGPAPAPSANTAPPVSPAGTVAPAIGPTPVAVSPSAPTPAIDAATQKVGVTPAGVAAPSKPPATVALPATANAVDTGPTNTPGTTPRAPTSPANAVAATRPPAATSESAPAESAVRPGTPAPGPRPAAGARSGNQVGSPSNLRVSRDPAPAGIDPAVAAGYAALADGNLDAAREHYSRALATDATNRDALLGLATVATRSGRTGAAESLYQRVLEIHPRDPYATAQLSALRSGNDAPGAESRVRNLLANESDKAGAAPLHFALGNQLAAQSRWAEAQQAYFNAFAAEPENPDYCFNLAVSLDQIRQPKLAHEHYARALDLAQKRRAGFDPARAKARMDQLAISAK